MVAAANLHFFGCASAPDGSGSKGYVYKLCGQGPSLDNYKLVLKVIDVDSAFITEFTLTDLTLAVRKAEGVTPSGEMMVGWLKQHCDSGTLDAVLSADGRLSLSFEQDYHDEDGDMTITVRLPPGEAPLPVSDAASAAWVAKSVLFSMSEHMRVIKRKLQDCELRCTIAQEYEDTSAFLAALNGGSGDGSAGDGGVGAGDGSGSEAGALVVPLAARVIPPAKRKQLEDAVVGSASKAAQPSGQAAAAGAAAATPAVGKEQQPASTQQTGGMSTQSRRTDLSEVGKPKRVAGRGRGRGRVPDPLKTQIGRRA